MPEPEESSHSALERLNQRLEAFDAAGADKSKFPGPQVLGIGGSSASDGYRVLGEMLGGVLGGVGFGWLVDRFAHTSPWGVVGGLVIGTGLSIYAVVVTASRMSARAASELNGSAPALPAVDDEDDD